MANVKRKAATKAPQKPAKTEPKVIAGRSLVESAFATIRRDILNGSLAPGVKLRFEMLYERYGVGASTLREALTRLVGETLVTSEEQRGFRVAEVSLEDFADLTRLRKLIELEALRDAILTGDDAWEAGVVAAFHRLTKAEERLASKMEGSHDDFESRNSEFHLALIAACPSRWLKHMHAILFQQAERYRRIAIGNRIVPRDLHGEHKAIVDAVLARDGERACRLEGEHIDRTLDVLNRVIKSKPLPHAAT
jgi:GntR family transcriptional regulator, carbon starvation induced regulator